MKAALVSGIILTLGVVGLILSRSDERGDPASIELRPEKTGLGTHRAGSTVEHQFTVTNDSGTSVEITEFKISCSCASLKPTRLTLSPGETADLTAQIAFPPVSSMGTESVKSFDVAILPFADGVAMRAWTLSAQVHSPLVISPGSFELFSGSSTASLAATESRIIGVDGSCDGGNVLISQKKDDTWHVEFVPHDDAFRLLPLFVSLNVEMQWGGGEMPDTRCA